MVFGNQILSTGSVKNVWNSKENMYIDIWP